MEFEYVSEPVYFIDTGLQFRFNRMLCHTITVILLRHQRRCCTCPYLPSEYIIEKKKKEDEKKKEKIEAKKMTGKVILETKGITKSYKFLADKPYTIAKSLVPKIKDYEGQQITLFGTFFQTKVLTITGVLNK